MEENGNIDAIRLVDLIVYFNVKSLSNFSFWSPFDGNPNEPIESQLKHLAH